MLLPIWYMLTINSYRTRDLYPEGMFSGREIQSDGIFTSKTVKLRDIVSDSYRKWIPVPFLITKGVIMILYNHGCRNSKISQH
jgi:hypothetical protein